MHGEGQARLNTLRSLVQLSLAYSSARPAHALLYTTKLLLCNVHHGITYSHLNSSVAHGLNTGCNSTCQAASLSVALLEALMSLTFAHRLTSHYCCCCSLISSVLQPVLLALLQVSQRQEQMTLDDNVPSGQLHICQRSDAP